MICFILFFQFDDRIQPLEALFYTFDLINKNEILLPNITLGLIAIDSCDSQTHASDQSLVLENNLLTMLTYTSFKCAKVNHLEIITK